MSAGELTDAARQRLAGCGVLLLLFEILAPLPAMLIGLAWLSRLARWP
jgi:hypothetical protein